MRGTAHVGLVAALAVLLTAEAAEQGAAAVSTCDTPRCCKHHPKACRRRRSQLSVNSTAAERFAGFQREADVSSPYRRTSDFAAVTSARRDPGWLENVALQQSKLGTAASDPRVLDGLRKVDAGRQAQVREQLREAMRRGTGGLRSLVGARVLCIGARLGGEVRAFKSLGALAVGIDLNPGGYNMDVIVRMRLATKRALTCARHVACACHVAWDAPCRQVAGDTPRRHAAGDASRPPLPRPPAPPPPPLPSS
jgi:hypothetical protein